MFAYPTFDFSLNVQVPQQFTQYVDSNENMMWCECESSAFVCVKRSIHNTGNIRIEHLIYICSQPCAV